MITNTLHTAQFYFQTYRGAGEPGRPRRYQLLLERVHLHALVLGDLVQVLVPVRERELKTVSVKSGEIRGWLRSSSRFHGSEILSSLPVAFTLIAIFPHAVSSTVEIAFDVAICLGGKWLNKRIDLIT